MLEKVTRSQTKWIMNLTYSGITNLRMTHVTLTSCSETIIH